jgi:hypothetical protein
MLQMAVDDIGRGLALSFSILGLLAVVNGLWTYTNKDKKTLEQVLTGRVPGSKNGGMS